MSQKGSIALPLLVLLIVLILVVFFFWGKNLLKSPFPATSQQTQSSTVATKTEYKNPFDKSTQYVNPFSEYKNPFDSLK